MEEESKAQPDRPNSILAPVSAAEPSLLEVRAGASALQEALEELAPAIVSPTIDGVVRTGTSDADILGGWIFKDVLSGLGGNDQLYGHDGDDTLMGGRGADTYIVTLGDQINETGDDGAVDTVLAWEGFQLKDNLEDLRALGSASIMLRGNSLANHIYGNDGDNNIDGLQGANDTLAGGKSNDIYSVSNAGDVVNERAGEGRDTVYVWGNAFALSADSEVEHIEMIGNGSASITGSRFSQLIYGLWSDDILDGGGAAIRSTEVAGATVPIAFATRMT